MFFKYIYALLLLTSIVYAEQYYYQKGKKVYLSPTKSKSSISRDVNSSINQINYFKTPQNVLVGVRDEILVKFKNTQNIQDIQITYSLSLVKQLSKTMFLFKVKDYLRTLDVSNSLYEESDVEFAHPNFLRSVRKR